MSNVTLKPSKVLSRQITSIAKRGRKLVDDIHEVASHVAVHAIVHGDVTLASRLVQACPRAIARRALVQWIAERAPVMWSNKKGEFVYVSEKMELFDTSRAEELLAEYLNGPRFDDKQPNDNQLECDVLRLVKGVIRRAEKAEEDGRTVKHAELLTKLRELVDAKVA